jgi:uncharacterized protein (TIGR03118 family)
LYRRPASKRRRTMWLSSILRFERSRSRLSVRRAKPATTRRFVPRLENLEDRTVPSGYQQINLVAEVPGVAPHTDPNLNGWGMDVFPNGPYVVADSILGHATFYDANGKVLPQVVTIPHAPSQPLGPRPTQTRGVVYNPTSEFVISEDGRAAPAVFLFGTRDGTISGWNPAVDPDHAILMVDNSAEFSTAVHGAMYSSLHIAQNSKGQNVLYAADRGHNRVDMFDGQFHFLGSFSNPNVSVQSAGHPGAWQVDDAPNGRLFVTYAMDNGPGGPYGGIVDIFDTDGHLLTPNHFAANGLGAGPLENPWGITQAPADFGQFSNDILIGNADGPGYINAFDPTTGAYLGRLTHPDGTPIAIPGVWYLTFGGGNPGTGLTKQLYFDAGPTLEQSVGLGLFGRIIAAGVGDGAERSADSSASMAALMAMLPGSGPASAPLQMSGTLSQSGGPQSTSVASQPVAPNVNSPFTPQQTVPILASAAEPILQNGESQIVTHVFDALFVGLTTGQDDVLGEFRW